MIDRHRAAKLLDCSSLACGLVACSLVLMPVAAAAQHVVEGRIVAASDGMPVEDVTVRAVGEDLVIGTDSAGVFRFELPDDRPGVALEVEVIGYQTFNRTWILPLEGPIVIGLRQEAVELEGIDVEVRVPVLERMERRLRGNATVTSRVADQVDLRRFPHQGAEIWDFLPAMNVARGFGAALNCPDCMMMNGTFEAKYFVDDFEVGRGQFRSYPVGEICRVEVVREPPKPRPNSRLVEARGGVHAYTCDFMNAVARGEASLSPFLWPWDSLMGPIEERLRRGGGGGVDS